MPEPHVVTVEIRGQRYPIRSSLDTQYVTGLAVYVDEKMRAASESPDGADSEAGGARGAQHRRRALSMPGCAAGGPRGAVRTVRSP